MKKIVIFGIIALLLFSSIAAAGWLTGKATADTANVAIAKPGVFARLVNLFKPAKDTAESWAYESVRRVSPEGQQCLTACRDEQRRCLDAGNPVEVCGKERGRCMDACESEFPLEINEENEACLSICRKEHAACVDAGTSGIVCDKAGGECVSKCKGEVPSTIPEAPEEPSASMPELAAPSLARAVGVLKECSVYKQIGTEWNQDAINVLGNNPQAICTFNDFPLCLFGYGAGGIFDCKIDSLTDNKINAVLCCK